MTTSPRSITDALLGEHGLLRVLCNVTHDLLDQDDPAPAQALAAMLDAVLKSHQDAEERFLLHALEPALDGLGPLEAMRVDHDGMHTVLARAAEHQEPEVARQLLKQAITLTRRHLLREEQVLFRLGDAILDADTQATMGQRWATTRDIGVEAPTVDDPDPGSAGSRRARKAMGS